ncbi:MAG: 50S ribosomal protein L5 [Candidatus Krumholzibacteria bacterium]|nr:50S ribosomal protein L5 [Candidatus Krumholzibacteria bacterium]MDH4338132.1 50S ribosomal protein L5 [Candidatus Krumholzibacteria bacterium]MDH5270974.1 50S ribosomal protein L5 [Candidatus Krumholzibacteria bacterium]
MARLREIYEKEVVPALRKDFGFKNVMEVPRIEKIVVNMGVGEAVSNGKLVDSAMDDLALITGQKPRLNRARVSVAAFKLRENMPIGCKVTLRGERMYEFYDRLVNVSLPRIRDFRGVPSRGFDGRGNFTMGIKEHIIFPEIEYDKIVQVFGMDITIVTSARTDEQALALLTHMKMPFRKN